MTEEEKLALIAITYKLNAIGCALDAVMMLSGANLEPSREKRREYVAAADEMNDKRLEHGEKAVEFADRLNELWGFGCNE